jgi:transposase
MVRPDIHKWGQSPSDLRRLSVEAEHPRSRERFLALYMISSEQTSAYGWSKEVGRTKETVLQWVHRYNDTGPDGVMYRHTGGRTPFLPNRRLTS